MLDELEEQRIAWLYLSISLIRGKYILYIYIYIVFKSNYIYIFLYKSKMNNIDEEVLLSTWKMMQHSFS